LVAAQNHSVSYRIFGPKVPQALGGVIAAALGFERPKMRLLTPLSDSGEIVPVTVEPSKLGNPDWTDENSNHPTKAHTSKYV
jgi:hypothetical protein